MAAAVGPVIFVVVVVGGLGSLGGRLLLASLLIALVQTFAVACDGTLLPGVSLAQVAPMLPYLLLVLVLLLRPAGLFGSRGGLMRGRGLAWGLAALALLLAPCSGAATRRWRC